MFKILFRFEVVGRENFPREGGIIVASNHLSYLDPIAVGLAAPRRLKYLAREDLFCNKLFGFLLTKLDAVPIKKDKGYSRDTFRKSFQILAAGKGLTIFPEGTRSQDGKLKKMQGGVGFLAVRSGCPVIPVLVTGTDKALPVKSKFIKPKKIIVYVSKALFPGEVAQKKANFEEFNHRVEETIKDMDAKFRKC